VLSKAGPNAFPSPPPSPSPSPSPSAIGQADLDKLLAPFADIMAEELPNVLPPSRGNLDHHIPLQPGASPPNSRQFRLSYAHTDEAKKQVTELEKQGLIRPSTSPFASAILFVPKPRQPGKWQYLPSYGSIFDAQGTESEKLLHDQCENT
jgi:hypothetical protein